MIPYGHSLTFAAIAAMTIASAVLVVTVPNILRSALFLAFTFLGVAGLYVLANAEFLAAMQVLIYVGAITVLIMFAIVLTQQLMGAKIRQATNLRMVILGAPIAGLVFVFLVKAFIQPLSEMKFNATPAPAGTETIKLIAKSLIRPHVLPFELASFVLLVALIGAIVIAKEDRK